MIESERVPELVDRYPMEIIQLPPGLSVSQRSAVRVPRPGIVKDSVGFEDRAVGESYCRHRECVLAEGLSENCAGEEDRILVVVCGRLDRRISDNRKLEVIQHVVP